MVTPEFVQIRQVFVVSVDDPWTKMLGTGAEIEVYGCALNLGFWLV